MVITDLHRFMKHRSSIKWFVGFCLVSVVSTVSVSGHSPSPRLSFSLGQVAGAQTETTVSDLPFTLETIENYARAVLGIEEIRSAALADIQTMMGANVPSIACHQEDSLRELPKEVQDSVVEFCQNSIAVVEDHSLTVPEFNEITATQRQDNELATAVQDALVRVQSGGVGEVQSGGVVEDSSSSVESQS